MNRSELLKAVTVTMIGVDKSGSPTGMDFLIFDDNWVRSFNDILSVSYQIQTGVSGAVKAHELIKVLDKMEGETIRVAIEKDKLLIKDSKTTLKMTRMEDKALNHLQGQLTSLKTDNLKWKPLPEGFVDGLEVCLFAAGTAPELGVLGGVAFKDDFIIATDRYRITLASIKTPLTESFVLPTEVVNGLSKFGKELKKISITDAWAHFKSMEGMVISARRILGEYPFDKLTKIFETSFKKEGKAKTYTLPNDIGKSIGRAEVLAGAEREGMEFLTQITLKRVGRYLIMSGRKEAGEIEDKMEWEEGKDFPENIELKLSPIFLKKIIGVSKSFQLSPTKTTVLFKGKNFKHLMVAEVK